MESYRKYIIELILSKKPNIKKIDLYTQTTKTLIDKYIKK